MEPPIPVSSRLWGLPKDMVKEVEKLFRAVLPIRILRNLYVFQVSVSV